MALAEGKGPRLRAVRRGPGGVPAVSRRGAYAVAQGFSLPAPVAQGFSLTFCTHERKTCFTTSEVVDLALSQIRQAAHKWEFAIHAYVFMPDHVHLLVEGLSEASDLKAFASLAKQRAGYADSRAGRGPLWQPSYYEHVLRDEEDSLGVVWYIVNNPVRAGLVQHPTAYPFVGSATYSIQDLQRAVSENGSVLWQP